LDRLPVWHRAGCVFRNAEALSRLESGPRIIGVRQRDEIGSGLRTLHVGRPGRHVILFRVGSAADRTIDVLRILHDAMDLARRAPSEYAARW
jgi:toxin ParE1/3/4